MEWLCATRITNGKAREVCNDREGDWEANRRQSNLDEMRMLMPNIVISKSRVLGYLLYVAKLLLSRGTEADRNYMKGLNSSVWDVSKKLNMERAMSQSGIKDMIEPVEMSPSLINVNDNLIYIYTQYILQPAGSPDIVLVRTQQRTLPPAFSLLLRSCLLLRSLELAAVETCLQSHSLATTVIYSSIIPAFSRHVTVSWITSSSWA
jgi:hypothetical protein